MQVFLAYSLAKGKVFVCKFTIPLSQDLLHLSVNNNNQTPLLEDSQREVEVMRKLSGKDHIIALEEYFEFPSFYTSIIVVPYIPSLPDLDARPPPQQIPSSLKQLLEVGFLSILTYHKSINHFELVFLSYYIQALASVHEAGYLHMDIKPNNILFDLTNNNQLTLIDFGCSVPESRPKYRGSTLHPKWYSILKRRISVGEAICGVWVVFSMNGYVVDFIYQFRSQSSQIKTLFIIL